MRRFKSANDQQPFNLMIGCVSDVAILDLVRTCLQP